jgi:hypothetical protein
MMSQLYIETTLFKLCYISYLIFNTGRHWVGGGACAAAVEYRDR